MRGPKSLEKFVLTPELTALDSEVILSMKKGEAAYTECANKFNTLLLETFGQTAFGLTKVPYARLSPLLK